jgi:hypothetical protein
MRQDDDNFPVHTVEVYRLRFQHYPQSELEKIDANLAIDQADIHHRFPGSRPTFWERRFIAVTRMRQALAELMQG